MHIINYVSISFRQAKKSTEPLALEKAIGVGHAARHSTCVSRAHTPTTSDVTARATTSFNQHVEHFIICGTLLCIIMWNIYIIILIFILVNNSFTFLHLCDNFLSACRTFIYNPYFYDE